MSPRYSMGSSLRFDDITPHIGNYAKDIHMYYLAIYIYIYIYINDDDST